VGSKSQWETTLETGVSKPSVTLEGYEYTRVWDAVGEKSPPVAMTEKTYEEDGDTSETDQFMMLYERPISDNDTEAVLISAEEKLVNNNFDRCLVTCTGFNIGQADIKING
jgi:hypothetical protein